MGMRGPFGTVDQEQMGNHTCAGGGGVKEGVWYIAETQTPQLHGCVEQEHTSGRHFPGNNIQGGSLYSFEDRIDACPKIKCAHIL